MCGLLPVTGLINALNVFFLVFTSNLLLSPHNFLSFFCLFIFSILMHRPRPTIYVIISNKFVVFTYWNYYRRREEIEGKEKRKQKGRG